MKIDDNYYLANILYNKCLDLGDLNDIHFADEEIKCISKEIQILRNNECNCLINILEYIAHMYDDVYNWHKGYIKKLEEKEKLL